LRRERTRNVVLILVGVGGLLASHHADLEFAQAHGANLSFSFAAFFLVRFLGITRPALTAACTFTIVAAQEFAQMFGLYPGWFDWWDLVFDAAGVALAWIAHRLIPCGK
jgi:hypothetical protein